jgi:uncharacterized lipoprotein YmbA
MIETSAARAIKALQKFKNARSVGPHQMQPCQSILDQHARDLAAMVQVVSEVRDQEAAKKQLALLHKEASVYDEGNCNCGG